MVLKGLDTVVRNLQQEITAIKGRTRLGMSEAGLFIQERAMAITPVELSTLVNSAFSITNLPGSEPIITTVGYTASYAPYVHEMPETTNWTKPGTGPKFLERPIRENTRMIVNLVARSASV